MEFTREQIEAKAKELRRAYERAYAAKNKEERKEQQRRCWEKKAIAALEQEAEQNAK